MGAPAAEEAVKTLGVLLMGYRRPDGARAFLWGVSVGAGFALVEGLLNGALALGGQEAWALRGEGLTLQAAWSSPDSASRASRDTNRS